jgi:hypothetical protein
MSSGKKLTGFLALIVIVAGGYFLAAKLFITEPEPKSITKKEVVKKRPYFYGLLHELYSQTPVTDVETLIIGDSHVQVIPWANLLASPGMISMGVGGDTFSGIRDRLDDVLRLTPAKIILMAGTNDVNKGKTSAVITNDIQAIASEITSRLPECEIVIVSVFPFSPVAENQKLKNKKVAEINERLPKIAGPKVKVVDLFSTMKTWDQSYFYDDWHLSSKGYLFVRDALKSNI